jgi:hypothetical protein
MAYFSLNWEIRGDGTAIPGAVVDGNGDGDDDDDKEDVV